MLARLNDLPQATRVGIFIAIAVVLGVLGLLASGTGDSATEPAVAAESVPGGQPVVQSGAGAPSAPSAAADPAAPTAAVPEGVGDLTLPVSPEELTSAAQTAVAAVAKVGSYRFDQDDAAWAAEVAALTTDAAAADLIRALPTGEARAAMSARQLVMQTSAHVSDVGMVSDGAVMLTVAATQATTADGQTSTEEISYLVAVTNVGGWKVSSLEPASSGDFGEITP